MVVKTRDLPAKSPAGRRQKTKGDGKWRVTSGEKKWAVGTELARSVNQIINRSGKKSLYVADSKGAVFRGYPTPAFWQKRLDLLDSKGVDFFSDDKEAARIWKQKVWGETTGENWSR
jgi:hypothetical protein